MTAETLLLAVGRERDRELLAAHLGETYEMVEPGGSSLPEFDACLLDRLGDALARRREGPTGLLPVVLVADGAAAPLLDGPVNEVVRTPLDRAVLDARLSNLLERRRQSLALAERKDAELRDQRALTEGVLDALPDVFFLLDADGKLVRWNDRLEAVTGYDADGIRELDSSEIIAPGGRERAAATVRRALVEGEVRSAEVELVGQDGEPIPYEFSIAPLQRQEDEERGAVGIGRDITNRRRRRQLAAQNERLEKFASIVSHDLRNPLSVAEGFVGLERERRDSENLERAGDALERMEALVDDLLVLAREGQVVEEPVPVDLRAVVIDALASVDAPNATLVSPDSVSVLADPPRLTELFENLFRNAVEHAGPAVTVTVEATPDGFRVHDDGPGLPAGGEQAFEHGFTTAEGGTGFGLAIVSEIADAHGWQVSAADGPTEGACFDVTGVERA